jgi:penicillin-binding protein 1A
MEVHPAKELMLDKAPYFAEKVRRHLLKTYGEKKLYDEGLNVYTTVDMHATQLAQEAVFRGLRQLSNRQGYRRDAEKSVVPGKKYKGTVTNPLYHINLKTDLKKYLARHKKNFGELTPENMKRGTQYQGVVLSVEKKKAMIQVGSVKRSIHLDDLLWATDWNPVGGWASVQSVAEVLNPGDVVLVRATDSAGTRDELDHRNYTKPLPKKFFFVLGQVPSSQAALIAKDPFSGYVKAIMGGYDFEMSEFDRTSQACRQPGSAIKPLFYAHALERKNGGQPLFTSASMILDAPVTVADANFKPANYENSFKGEVTFWEALVHSMNSQPHLL